MDYGLKTHFTEPFYEVHPYSAPRPQPFRTLQTEPLAPPTAQAQKLPNPAQKPLRMRAHVPTCLPSPTLFLKFPRKEVQAVLFRSEDLDFEELTGQTRLPKVCGECGGEAV